jgi:hypothetical protein
MEFVELHHEVCLEFLLCVPELVVFLDIFREENSNAPVILVIDQTFMPMFVVDESLQDLYAGGNWVYTRHHV